MTSVYNLLREACGISQAEAADYVHETRLDTVKSWSSDRRPAPSWAINQLQSLSRRIRRAGELYGAQLKELGPSVTVPAPIGEEDARAQGFPSIAAMMQALAIAISLLPDDAEIHLWERPRGNKTPMIKLEEDKVIPTTTDRRVLMAMNFDQDGKFYTAGNMNRRKFERLEAIGWVKGHAVNMSDVAYYITPEGKKAYAVKRGDVFKIPQDGIEQLMTVISSAGETIMLRNENGRPYQCVTGDVRHLFVGDATAVMA